MLSIKESRINLFPIDNFPNFSQEFRSFIMIVNVISMLPNINSEKRNKMRSFITKSVLICSCMELKFFSSFIICQPSPSWTLNRSCILTKVLLQIFYRSEIFFNPIHELWTFDGQDTPVLRHWTQVIPEKFMVEMTSSIEFYSLRKINVFFMITSF